MAKMLFFSRTLLLALLIVDWVEDPHFGNYLFSRPMASSEASPLDLGFRHEKSADDEILKIHIDVDPAMEMTLPPDPILCVRLPKKTAEIQHSRNSLYALMSLQI